MDRNTPLCMQFQNFFNDCIDPLLLRQGQRLHQCIQSIDRPLDRNLIVDVGKQFGQRNLQRTADTQDAFQRSIFSPRSN